MQKRVKSKTGQVKKKAINISLSKSERAIIEERRGQSSINRYLVDCALRDPPKSANLPETLQREIAIKVFTLEKVLQMWMDKAGLGAEFERIVKDIIEGNKRGQIPLADLFPVGKQGKITKAGQEALATSILVMDAIVKDYLANADLAKLYETANAEARIRIMQETALK